MDARFIGKRAADGGVESYPTVDLAGQSYDMPPGTTIGLDETHFVVVPLSGDWSTAIEDARAYMAGLNTPTTELTPEDEPAPRKRKAAQE